MCRGDCVISSHYGWDALLDDLAPPPHIMLQCRNLFQLLEAAIHKSFMPSR